MPKFEFAVPKLSGDNNKDIKGLFNAYIDMSQNFQYLLTNLNETNVKRAKSVVADWVYAGNIKTDQLIAGEAKIDTALIDELIVGTNVDRGTAPIVFYATPSPPYKVNDIWIDGLDLYRCKIARESGAYVETDWELGTNYTNPSGVTTIIGGVVTTDYINALNVTAYSVNAEWVYAGNVETDQIVAGEAKIDTALIEDLIVGTNVTMGEGASISWSQVTDQPYIPDEYTDSDAISAINATYIDEFGVWTPHVYAENIDGTYITGKTLRTAASGKRLQIDSDGLYTYNDSENYNGVVIGESAQFRSIDYYNNGTKYGRLTLDTFNVALHLFTLSGYDLLLSTAGGGDMILDPSNGDNCYIGSNIASNKVATRGWVDDNYLAQSSGWSGSFTNGDGATVTVVNGQITSVA
jgi:hypothetical protein